MICHISHQNCAHISVEYCFLSMHLKSNLCHIKALFKYWIFYFFSEDCRQLGAYISCQMLECLCLCVTSGYKQLTSQLAYSQLQYQLKKKKKFFDQTFIQTTLGKFSRSTIHGLQHSVMQNRKEFCTVSSQLVVLAASYRSRLLSY